MHVSLTGIEYDKMNRVYSVFVKVWSDDLDADIDLGLFIRKERYQERRLKDIFNILPTGF